MKGGVVERKSHPNSGSPPFMFSQFCTFEFKFKSLSWTKQNFSMKWMIRFYFIWKVLIAEVCALSWNTFWGDGSSSPRWASSHPFRFVPPSTAQHVEIWSRVSIWHYTHPICLNNKRIHGGISTALHSDGREQDEEEDWGESLRSCHVKLLDQ